MKTLLFFCGSLRAASSARGTMRALVRDIDGRVEVTEAGIAALPHYNADIIDDPAVARLLAQVAAADGVVFVTPEYNYSVPGVLKNAIDWASRPGYASVFKGKPCLVVTTSGGLLGGVRAQAHLKYVLSALLARTFAWQEIVVPKANEKMRDGVLEDPAVLEFAGAALDAFIRSLDGPA
jgi:chromate reductase, NAD(P)H dehydrogenase (quinone)